MKILLVAVAGLYTAGRAALAYYDPTDTNRFQIVLAILLTGILFVGAVEGSDLHV